MMFSVDPKTLELYVEGKDWDVIGKGMHRSWIDEFGNERAAIVHGFAFDEYFIDDETAAKNFETVNIFKSFLNK